MSESRNCVSCGKATFGQNDACPFCGAKQPNKMKRGSTKNARVLSKGELLGLGAFANNELKPRAPKKPTAEEQQQQQEGGEQQQQQQQEEQQEEGEQQQDVLDTEALAAAEAKRAEEQRAQQMQRDFARGLAAAAMRRASVGKVTTTETAEKSEGQE